jgi:hypothetical protein
LCGGVARQLDIRCVVVVEVELDVEGHLAATPAVRTIPTKSSGPQNSLHAIHGEALLRRDEPANIRLYW